MIGGWGRWGDPQTDTATTTTPTTNTDSVYEQTTIPGVEATSADAVQAQVVETPVSDVEPQVVEAPMPTPVELPHWSELVGEPQPAAPTATDVPPLTPSEAQVRAVVLPLVQPTGPNLLTLAAGAAVIGLLGLGLGTLLRR